ncbi:MAG: diguanylate cyclase [Oscillospiraceae bacterium]|nr:diguanylate cyclase [Oscillospiraceae bacterium]
MNEIANSLVAGIYIPFAIMTFIIIIEISLRNIKHRGSNIFIVLCVLVFCWYALDVVKALTQSELLAKLFWNLILIFVGFIPPVLLLFVLDFYRLNLKSFARWTPLLFAVPSVTTLLALTYQRHALIYARLDIVSLSPTHEITRVWGPWFWAHTIHSYIVSMIIISIILVRHFNMPRFYRMPSTLMATGISITLLGNVITLMELIPASLDPTLIGTSLALIFFNFAFINNDRSKFVRFSHGKVFDYLDSYIFVFDESNHVAHANSQALEWLSSVGIALESFENDGITESLVRCGATRRELEHDKGVDFYFPAEPFSVVLNMHVQQMTDTNGDYLGSVVIFSDVTQNRYLINRLEERVGVDSLTGIPNRIAYEGAKNRLNCAENLPLSVIVCDVNGLKSVNDSFGHQYGDLLLQIAAETLEAACPGRGFIGRIGGDEFVFLLPRTDEATALDCMESIRAMIANRDNLPFSLSLALGAATKHTVDEDISIVIDLADSMMYENKRSLKAHE